MSDGRRFRLAATLLLIAATLTLAARLYRARFWFDFLDESAETTAAWLVSEGETLYGSIFSHHMPLPVVAGHLVAALSPTERPEQFRIVPFFAYLLAALAIARSPFERARPGLGRLGAAMFLFSVAVVAPNFWGHMLLADPLWGCAFLAATVLFVGPLLLGLAPTRGDATIAGATLVLAFSGSLVAAYPIALACLLGMTAILDPRRRQLALSHVPWVGAGAAVALSSLAGWLAVFGKPENFFEEAVRFNRDIYYRFTFGDAKIIPSVLADWVRYVRSAPEHIRHAELDAWFLVLAALSVTAVAWAASRTRRGHRPLLRTPLALDVAIWCLLVASLRMRNGGVHGLPFYLVVLGVLSLTAATLWAEGRQWVASALLVGALGPVVFFSARDGDAWSSPDRGGWESGTFGAIARHVRANTRADERFAVFPFPSSLYLLARRLPATDSIYYFPWQAAWEAERPASESACSQIRRSLPHFVFIWPVPLWGRFQWGAENWGACIDGFVKARYARVRAEEFGGLLWELRPGAPASGVGRP